MRMHRTVRLALATTAVVITALSLVAVPALAGTRSAKTTKDWYLAADTRLTTAATIGGAGSTFAAPLQNAAQVFYATRTNNASINGYQAVGSGTGESDIIKKLVDWGGSDVPMSQTDISQKEPSGDHYTPADFLQVPIALGGVAITYNVPGLTAKTTLTLTAAVLAEIYKGEVKWWNSSAIKALNPKVKLPHNKIVVAARGDSSGTTYIFTNFLYDAAPTLWTTAPSKSALTLPSGGIAGSGNAGVAADIENTPNSIGYVEYSYVLLNPGLLKGVAAIVNREGKALTPSTASIAAAAAAKPDVTATNFAIVWMPAKAAYPIAGYTWAIVWKHNQTSDAEGTLLVKYLDWLSHSGSVNGTTAGQDVAALQGYVPLPANIQALARTTLLKVVGSHGQVLLTKTGR
ncbi:MAG: phosphate ABC transporter substrate-binding protein PstS [Acidimicrobiales bacterium]